MRHWTESAGACEVLGPLAGSTLLSARSRLARRPETPGLPPCWSRSALRQVLWPTLLKRQQETGKD